MSLSAEDQDDRDVTARRADLRALQMPGVTRRLLESALVHGQRHAQQLPDQLHASTPCDPASKPPSISGADDSWRAFRRSAVSQPTLRSA